MVLGEVVGKVWADRILAPLQGRRLVLVRVRPDGPDLVAVDPLNVGVGTTVLVVTDEAAAAVAGETTVDAAVVALVADPDATDSAPTTA
ncbi:EutN/CcmL family microcompartment protein [Micromonospora sp. WMMD998]|uniref:EutN/CcmL family microcompartment protein n=1 Tax=Micromonospora sp. WMMD998 TaxID=3016092 RepID=UPI00249C6978|nr:EutN/CcmL family microcompartment protein [Micromonospora sp. WMMD998]WFE39879.1 EutN/CcmL family microcompartment protein [Micromonospora sp. WMMD998]